MPQSKTRAEQETIVRFSEDLGEGLTVFTHRERLARRLIRGGGTLKHTSKIEGEEESWTVECPREWFREPKAKRPVSPEKREEMRQRALERGFGARKPVESKAPEPSGAS